MFWSSVFKMGQNKSSLKHKRSKQKSSEAVKYKQQELNTHPIYNDQNMVPDWIHKSHFLEILAAIIPEFSKIENFFIAPALKAGENYSSLLLRICIDAKLTDKTVKSLSFMMKVPHESDKMQQALKTVNFFAVENATYTQLISEFEEIYQAKGININFAPRIYKFTDSMKKEPKLANTVLMYDLGQDGYRNIDRLECLDVEQTEMVLRKLAQYHAAGAHYRVINGPYPELFTQPMFGSNQERALSIIEGIMGPFKKMFLENLSCYRDGEKYLQKFTLLFSNMSRKFLSLSTYDPTEFNVINHGDCWINNLLFKFGPNNELNDMIFVDFQLPKFGHPSADLLNFLMTSVHIDHKLKCFDYFIKYYHDHLIEHLKLLEYEGRLPTLIELHMQLYKYGIWAITASVMVLPLVLWDQSKEQEYKCQLYTNARYKANIEQIMPWLDNRGLLEI